MRGDVSFGLHGALEIKNSVILQVHSQLCCTSHCVSLELCVPKDWNITINIIDLVIYQFFRKKSSVLRKLSHLLHHNDYHYFSSFLLQGEQGVPGHPGIPGTDGLTGTEVSDLNNSDTV